MLIVKFYSFTCNLDLDPITLVLEVDLDVAKMNACIENEVSSFRGLRACSYQAKVGAKNKEPTQNDQRIN